jgi:hypothetical protein
LITTVGGGAVTATVNEFTSEADPPKFLADAVTVYIPGAATTNVELLLTLLVLRPLELRANCSPPSEAVTSEIGLDSDPVETEVKLKLSETGNAVAATCVTLPSTGATIETTGGVNAGAAVTEA